MKIQTKSRNQSGYSALFITLILVGASVLMLGATVSRSTANARLNDRNTAYVMAGGAAEAAVEKVISQMMVDYAKSGEVQVQANMNTYQTGLLPTSTENAYWTNFVFSDGRGTDNAVYVARTSTDTNATFVQLTEQYSGLSGYASTYRVVANARMANSTYNYGFTNAVQQDVQLAQIPIFQFAIFYNSLLEFSDTATLVVNGRVHANSNIYVGSPSDLTFNALVTTTGNISQPGMGGISANKWSGKTTYNAKPSGNVTSYTALTLPVGTSNTADNVRQIITPPPAGEDVNSAMGQQRYYNNADMTLTIKTDNKIYITFKSSRADGSPYNYVTNVPNVLSNNFNTLYSTASKWSNASWATSFGMSYWMRTNTFYDFRESKTIRCLEINVGNLNSWVTNWLTMSTYSTKNPMYGKFTKSTFNLIYIADERAGSSSYLYAVRLTNGVQLPPGGLTLATCNPLYIYGNYNCPSTSNRGTTNTIGCAPASVACDALTILSPAWQDSYASSSKYSSRDATPDNGTVKADTVNTAIIAGIVYSTGSDANTFSGGVQNLPRLLEDWTSSTLTLNTSIVCLYNSIYASNQFQMPQHYYDAPKLRNFSFDQNYLVATNMPPGTPNICRLVRANWCNPPPNIVNATNLSSWDYVSR